jgi:hypothetical protein
MASSQRPKVSIASNGQNDRLALLEKLMQNHSDPDPVCYFPSQHTENDECLYEFELMEPKLAYKQ